MMGSPEYTPLSKQQLWQEGIDRFLRLQLAWLGELHRPQPDGFLLDWLVRQLDWLGKTLPELVQR